MANKITAIAHKLTDLGFSPDQDDYFGVSISDNGDGSFHASNNPCGKDFKDLDKTLSNLDDFDPDGDRSIFDCFK